MSILKSNYVNRIQGARLVSCEPISIKGVCGNLKSSCCIQLKLVYGDVYFMHNFYVFEGLQCATDGIIGEDFITRYAGIINYESRTFSMKVRGSNERVNMRFLTSRISSFTVQRVVRQLSS